MTNNKLYTEEYIHDTIMADPGYFWRKIKRVRSEYIQTCPFPGPSIEDFHRWILNEYGIEFIPTDNDFLANTFNIVDEQKYLLFELKYS